MSSRGKIVLTKHKILKQIWHPESALVFKSATEKLVIGRCENDKLIPLDDVSLDLCNKWKFKYDNSLVDEVSDESEEDLNHDSKEKNDEDDEDDEDDVDNKEQDKE